MCFGWWCLGGYGCDMVGLCVCGLRSVGVVVWLVVWWVWVASGGWFLYVVVVKGDRGVVVWL